MDDCLLLKGELRLLKDYCENKVVVELGTYTGESAKIIASVAKEIYTVDVYDIPIKSDFGEECKVNYSYEDNLRKFSNYKNIHIIKAVSWQAAENFDNNSLDVVFVDASHIQSNVTRDAINWKVKLKKGGLMLFHDYNACHKGVVDAVNKLIACDNDFEEEPFRKVYKNNSIKILRRV